MTAHISYLLISTNLWISLWTRYWVYNYKLIILFFIAYHVIDIILCHLFTWATWWDIDPTFDALLMPVYIDHLLGRRTIWVRRLTWDICLVKNCNPILISKYKGSSNSCLLLYYIGKANLTILEQPMPDFYKPNLSGNSNDPFAREGDRKLAVLTIGWTLVLDRW